MIQQSILMKFIHLSIFICLIKSNSCFNSTCLPCSTDLCYQCYNTLPDDRTNINKVTVVCDSSVKTILNHQDRFYSIIKSFTTINCTMKVLYLDQFTLWNYLEDMSITHANLTRLSPMSFNQTITLTSPILYSIKSLNLSYNSIRILNKNFSYYFPSLEKLDLSYNELRHIKRKTFENFLYLKQLYLNNNHLKQILPTIFSRQSLYFINLNMNYWHCSCTNILTLSLSRPIPNCYTPKEFQNRNVSDIARQCYLRTKTNILITTNQTKNSNLTCVLSSIIDEWKTKIIENVQILSSWHVEQRRSISLEFMSNLNNTYLICYHFNSESPESIYMIINVSTINYKKKNSITTVISNNSKTITHTNTQLSPFFLWILNTSKSILPKYIQKSDKRILIVWLILLIIAIFIFIYLIYFIYHHRVFDRNHFKDSRSYTHLNTNPDNHRTLFNIKFTCQNHRCLCQYRRRIHSTFQLTKSQSLNQIEKPLFIEPRQLRYAKIKRISSTRTLDNDYLAGEFRTTVKLKNLPC